MVIKYAVFIALCLLATYCYSQDSLVNRRDAKGLKTGKWVSTWETSGKIASVEHFMAGRKTGICLYYNEGGRLTNEISYVRDTMDGLFKFYSVTGQKEVAEFRKGKREGVTQYYNHLGMLVEDYQYINNVRNGVCRTYYNSGRISTISYYVDGAETGTRKTLSDDLKGEVILETDFIDDQRLEKRFYKSGKLIRIVKEKSQSYSRE